MTATEVGSRRGRGVRAPPRAAGSLGLVRYAQFFLQFQDVATVIAPEQSPGLLYCLGASVTTQLLLWGANIEGS